MKTVAERAAGTARSIVAGSTRNSIPFHTAEWLVERFTQQLIAAYEDGAKSGPTEAAKPEPVTHAPKDTIWGNAICGKAWSLIGNTGETFTTDKEQFHEKVSCPKCRTALGLNTKPANVVHAGDGHGRAICGASTGWQWVDYFGHGIGPREREEWRDKSVTCPACRKALRLDTSNEDRRELRDKIAWQPAAVPCANCGHSISNHAGAYDPKAPAGTVVYFRCASCPCIKPQFADEKASTADPIPLGRVTNILGKMLTLEGRAQEGAFRRGMRLCAAPVPGAKMRTGAVILTAWGDTTLWVEEQSIIGLCNGDFLFDAGPSMEERVSMLERFMDSRGFKWRDG